MDVNKRIFGKLADGSVINCWTITNDAGLQAEILDYGVTVRSIMVPDRNGNFVDIVLGYDTLVEYVSRGGYLGATIGRFANRIGNASFELNGKNYPLHVNSGSNHIHGGKIGFDKVVWNCRQEENTLIFSRLSPNGEEGYPGNLMVTVRIGWNKNSLEFQYAAETDQDTILNLTNHSYFNLNGDGNGEVLNHMMQIQADYYTVTDASSLPTGELASVQGSAMDFRVQKMIGQDITNDEDCVMFCNGYNSNMIISGHPVAVTKGDKTGIVMITDTDQPGVQFYVSKMKEGTFGKNRHDYGGYSSFCLETQHYPDCVHHPKWPTCILRQGEKFESITKYSFFVENEG